MTSNQKKTENTAEEREIVITRILSLSVKNFVEQTAVKPSR